MLDTLKKILNKPRRINYRYTIITTCENESGQTATMMSEITDSSYSVTDILAKLDKHKYQAIETLAAGGFASLVKQQVKDAVFDATPDERTLPALFDGWFQVGTILAVSAVAALLVGLLKAYSLSQTFLYFLSMLGITYVSTWVGVFIGRFTNYLLGKKFGT